MVEDLTERFCQDVAQIILDDTLQQDEAIKRIKGFLSWPNEKQETVVQGLLGTVYFGQRWPGSIVQLIDKYKQEFGASGVQAQADIVAEALRQKAAEYLENPRNKEKN